MGGEGGELPILAEIDFKIVSEGGGEWGPLKGGDGGVGVQEARWDWTCKFVH